MSDQPSLSVEAQLAVLGTKIDTLIEYNKQRGEDHEVRIRKLEDARPDFITKKAATGLVIGICTVLTATSNAILFFTR